MKNIILALMMISSFSFAVESELCVSINGNSVKVINPAYYGSYGSGVCVTVSGYDSSKNKYVVLDGGVCYWNASAFSGYAYSITSTACNLVPTCTSSQELLNGVCVPKCSSSEERLNGVCVPSCDQLASSFRTSSGECQDCITSTSFSGRSSCACDSQGSTYTPQSVMSIDYTTGNYTYKKTNITCDNGTRIAIYTDPKNNNPQDYNSTYKPNDTAPSPENNSTTTTPVDTNTTAPVQTNNDVVNAIKAETDIQKDIKTDIGKVATDVKAMNEHLAKQGVTFDQTLAAIKANGTENAKSNQLLSDISTGQTEFKNKFGQWVIDDQKNSNAQLGATNGVKNAVDGTTTAVNNQGKNITDKLDDVIKAIKEDGNTSGTKDGNGTDLTKVEEKLDTLHKDNNSTHSKLDTLHDDSNKTNSTLTDIKNLLDFNSSKYTLENMLPSGGEGWFTSNALNLKFNIPSGNCYCETASFTVAGRNFVFPPQGAFDIIPFSLISNIFMAFIYVLGLKNFLKS